MTGGKIQIEVLLKEMAGLFRQTIKEKRFEEAKFFLEQYIKLAPSNAERYVLEADFHIEKVEIRKAQEVLVKGLQLHPLSFELLLKLGRIGEIEEDYFEAYYQYMKAKYAARTDQEKEQSSIAIKGLVNHMSSGNIIKDDQVVTSIKAGDKQINLTAPLDQLLQRKKLLSKIEKHIQQDCITVLELGFNDGVISKTLNYLGYNVTAVDPQKEHILQVIALEWHDHILEGAPRTAKYYVEEINQSWLEQIPVFDIIMAINQNNLLTLGGSPEEESKIISLLLEKTRHQLFLRVNNRKKNLESGISYHSLDKFASDQKLKTQIIHREEEVQGEGEIILIEKTKNSKSFQIPNPFKVKNSKSTLFDVEVAKCKDLYGAGYINDFHPFVAVLKEYEENQALKYQDSILKSYYANFTPANLEDGLFGQRREAAKLRSGWIGLPWYWHVQAKVIFEPEPGETRPGGHHFFGPNTDEFGEKELFRLIHSYNLLKTQGYLPELFSDGYIAGYLLLKENDYRFVVTEGQHRMACLAALGYTNVRCRFSGQPQYPRAVELKEIKKWPQVVNGAYSRNLAQKVFLRYFAQEVGQDRRPS